MAKSVSETSDKCRSKWEPGPQGHPTVDLKAWPSWCPHAVNWEPPLVGFWEFLSEREEPSQGNFYLSLIAPNRGSKNLGKTKSMWSSGKKLKIPSLITVKLEFPDSTFLDLCIHLLVQVLQQQLPSWRFHKFLTSFIHLTNIHWAFTWCHELEISVNRWHELCLANATCIKPHKQRDSGTVVWEVRGSLFWGDDSELRLEDQ